MAQRQNRVTIEPFRDWQGRRKFLVSCKRHTWYAEVFLEENANSLMIAHNCISHGVPLHVSEWALQQEHRQRHG